MKNIFLLSQWMLFLGIHMVSAQVMWQVTDEKAIPWYYLDGDEFSGTLPDTAKWLSCYPWGRTLHCNREQQFYSDWKNHRFENGVLQLETRREKVVEKVLHWEADQFELKCGTNPVGVNKRQFEYTSGMIFSQRKYHYGFYEIRFKSSKGKGLWPAFWLYAGHDNDEIDIFEMKGERNSEMHVDVHCKSGCNNYKTTLGLLRKNWGDFLSASSGWHEGYNVISIEWRPNYIKWYLNGKGIALWNGKFDYPMWVIANLAIPSDNGPFGPGPDAETAFPAFFEIDYIRIWAPSMTTRKEPVIFQKAFESGNRNFGTASKTALPSGKKRPEYSRAALKQEVILATFAKNSIDGYTVDFSGNPGDDFLMEVTDVSGKISYQSSDNSVREHHFKSASNGNSVLKMKLKGNWVEHRF